VTATTTSLLHQAREDYLAGRHHAARQALEAQANLDLEAAGLLALCWVRQVLSDCPHGVYVDAPVLQAALSTPFDHPRLEADRRFGLGWLHWLAGDPALAEPHLSTAVQALLAEQAAGEAAYWLGRVRLLCGQAAAVGEFERVLKGTPAAPPLTCWFVDLLWRSGQFDRVEGVWKTVRSNKRVLACDESPLLEARLLLHRGEAAPAERLLADARPRGGVVEVERLLLLAWAVAAQNRMDQAADLLRQAEAGPYPVAALRTWQQLLDLRSGRTMAPVEAVLGDVPGVWRDWLAGQRARAEGRCDEATTALRSAAAVPALAPFARYALACLGEGDFGAVLGGQPGWFLAARCRARVALDRFCRRDASPAEWLAALQLAETAGYRPPAAEHFRRLALALKQRTPHAEDLRRLVDRSTEEGEPAAGNVLRAAVEVAACLLPPREAVPLLCEWAQTPRVGADDSLRTGVGRELLRLVLRGAGPAQTGSALGVAESLLDRDPFVPLVRAWTYRTEEDYEHPHTNPLLQLWKATVALARPLPDPLHWRREVLALRSHPRLRGLVLALCVHEAATCGDVAALAALLQDREAWTKFPSGPPLFVVQAVRCALGTQTILPQWRSVLARWLETWDGSVLPPEVHAVAVQAGLARAEPGTAEPPAGLPATVWLLHQAAEALTRNDAAAALAWVGQARATDPDLNGAGAEAVTARAALGELQRLASLHQLAEVVRLAPGQPAVEPRLLADLCDALQDHPSGCAVLDAARRCDLRSAREALTALAQSADLSPRLAHHLALVFTRAALFLDEQGGAEAAALCWRSAWQCWLRHLGQPASAPLTADHPLLAYLFGRHRRSIAQWLARDEVSEAQRFWGLLLSLPEQARAQGEALGSAVDAAVVRFREDLATEHLVAAREALRSGSVPEGYRADYEKGLSVLGRILGLERDNVRLLTALVEICDDWFQDLYTNEEARVLWEGVERYTPLAVRLAQAVAARPSELAARAALSRFFMVRGFVSPEREQKLTLYREALEFDPSNDNARALLQQEATPLEGRQ
jgi:tetratricopeptide (TPR) repeat protein